MNNYEFCINWILEQQGKRLPKLRILDYGCGKGIIVKGLREKNIEAFGCDIYYGGGNKYNSLDPALISNKIICKMNEGLIPFDSSEFDIIVNNQVMEHVENLDNVLNEISRVLKPEGKVLSLFPDKSVWREGHCGIPFLHWFPKKSNFRIYYATCFRLLGFGYHKKNMTPFEWSKYKCNWLDEWTHYRSQKEIKSAYLNFFPILDDIEVYWLKSRAGKIYIYIAWLPKWLQRCIANKLGNMVFVARKRPLN